jgi:hypothetical protein
MTRSAALALCGVLLALTLVSAEPKPATPEVPRRLLEERLVAARSVYEQDLLKLQQGEIQPNQMVQWSENWLEAELRLEPRQAERVQSLRDNLDRLRNIEQLVRARVEAGRGRNADVLAVKYYRLGAEIRLIEAGATGRPPEVKREE